jgi:chemotaxis protein methyltransferase CheR
MDDQQFRQLLSRFGFSWDGYRKVRRGVKKRVSRHMQQTGCRTMQAYFSVLDQDEGARKHFERLMTVSISRFFRDRRLWEVLQTEILPAIIEEHRNGVKVWSAGCACGEEVYSLKILWETACGHFDRCPALEIWASDMNPIYLNKAQTGIYPRSSLKEVPEPLRVRYFHPLRKAKRYAISEGLKQGILWREHNVLFDSPGIKFHLVFLRNSLLTYYEAALENAAFQKVLDTVAQGGFLIIGSHERIPPGEWGVAPSVHHPCIYHFEGFLTTEARRTQRN